MKANDWIAINLNIQGTEITPDDLRLYNINPDNTGLKDKEYYENIPQVQNTFKKNDGTFDKDAFNAFYDSAKRAYTDFATNDYVNGLIQSVPTSANDIFSLGNTNIADDTARIVRTRDPQRHAIGIGNIFETGAPSFSEREVAQSSKVLDENGNQLDWSPEDKGGFLKALFRPTLALATWDSDGTHIENGIEVTHHKGDHKYNEFGDPQYQMVGKNEIYGKDVLHYSDTFTKEGSIWNKIDIFDNDGIKSNAAKTVARTVAKIVPYLTPYGYVFGAVEAASALGQTIPVLTKAINGMFTGDNTNSIGQKATSVENFMSRFNSSQSDAGQGKFWSIENIGQMISDSASQLYSQRLIQKVPKLLAKWKDVQPSIKSMKIGQNLSLAYMAATSAEDVYGAYKQAGVNDQMAGVGALATMGAFYWLMNHEYFKEMLFRDPGMELPELKQALYREAGLTGQAIANRQLTNEGLKTATGPATAEAAAKWYQKAFTSTKSLLQENLPKLKALGSPFSTNVYLSRSINEGIEETMEEGVTDFAKGLTLGLQALGFDIKDKDASEVNFGFSPEDFLSRYTSSFIGGAFGGAVFEGLTQWDNKVLHRNIRRISDLEDSDLQLTWYIRNGYGKELMDIIDSWEKKGKFGSKNLSWNYKIDTDAEGKKKLVYNTGSVLDNQNLAIANILRQRIKYKAAQLESLNLMLDDNQILSKALEKIKSEAKAEGYTDLNKFRDERLRDERIDFIRNVGVDRIIIADVADLQKKQTDLLERIEDRETDLLQGSDSQAKDARAAIENDETLKRLRKDFDSYKTQLNDLLSGKRANEYLELGIFLGDHILKNLYVSELGAENNTPSYFEESVKNFVRAKYNENYDEIVAREGEKTKEYLDSEYAAWTAEQDSSTRLRHAFTIHQNLSKLLWPVIENQIKNYSEYKTDPERSNVITATEGAIDWDSYEQQLSDAENALQQAIATPGTDSETIETLTKNVANLQAIVNLRTNPKRILEVLFKQTDENDPELNSLEKLGELQDNKTILNFLKNYYKRLNDEKIVSEFSDDLMNRGLLGVSENLRYRILSKRNDSFSGTLESLFFNVAAEANNLGDNFANVLARYLNDDSLRNVKISILDDSGNKIETNVHDALNELNLRYNNANNLIITYNGKTQHILDHINDIAEDSGLDNIYDDFAEFGAIRQSKQNENSTILNKEQFALFESKFADVINAIGNNPDGAEDAYKNLVSYITEAIKNGTLQIASVTGNAENDAKSFVDSILFSDGVNVIDEINQLKQLRANMIHTPILDWIEALSLQLNKMPTHLWQMLKDEQKRLYDKQRLDDYVIKDPFVLNELDFLQSALVVAKALYRGMLPLGANSFINKLRKEDKREELPVLTNLTLADVYGSDLDIISERLNYLLDLHNSNKQSTVKQKMQSMIVGAPKFIQAIIGKTSTDLDEKDPAIFIGDKLKELGIEDVSKLWKDSGGIDPNTVTEENFSQFWSAMRNFMNALYDKVQKFDSKDGKDRLDAIADVLVSGFTDLWKLKNSTISHKKEAILENLDVLYWLASVIAFDPRTTFGLIKTVESTSEIQPFWDQLLNIQIGFSRIESSELFNKLLDKIIKTVNNSNLDNENKGYILNKSKILNSMFIDGAAGTGKSSVVLKYIREMRKLLHPNAGALAVSQYEERTEALKVNLNVSDKDTLTKNKLIETLLGRSLTSNDFTSNEGHVRVLKDSVLEELSKRSDIWKSLLDGRDGLDIYVDESGFLSEAEFQFFSKASEMANIRFIFAGDKMQNGTIVEQKDPKTGEIVYNNSGVFDIVATSGPRLNLSMRAGNLGMINNLNRVEQMVQKMLDVYSEKPWLNPKEIWNLVSNEMSPYKFEYFESENALYGIAPTSNPQTSIEKLKSLPKTSTKGPKIVIISDHIDDYTSYRSSDIDVLDIGAVQGGEYDYYLIDVKNVAKSGNFDYLRNVYTIISRARKGGYVVGNLGNLFPGSVVNNTASIIVNPIAESGNDSDSVLSEYKNFFNNLFKDETWSATSGSNPTGTPTGTPSGTPPPPVIPGTPTPVEQSFSRVNNSNNPYDGWKGVDNWRATVRAEGAKASHLLFGGNQKTKAEDFENYKMYQDTIEKYGKNGTLIETKSFIDWLFSNDSNDILFGDKSNITSVLGRLTSEQETNFKKLVRNLSLDLIVLDKATRQKKYNEGVKVKNSWTDLAPNNDNWLEVVNKLFAAVAATDDLELYAITDGGYCYLYFTFDNIAIPVARIQGANHQGYVKLNTTRVTPMIVLSTDGNSSENIQTVVGNYVDLNDKAFIIGINENDIDADNDEVTRYIRQNKGKPLAYLSDTFDDDDTIKIISPKSNNGKINRIDQTGETNGHKRFNAISKRIDLETYIRLSKLLHDAQTKGVSESELDELKFYFSGDVTSIIANDDVEEIIKLLRKFSLLGQENRSQLTSALMRYFWTNRNTDPNSWLHFRENITGWVASDEWLSKDGTKIRQKGLSFTIYGDTGTYERFNVLYDKSTNQYNVRVQTIEDGEVRDSDIGQLSADQWASAQDIDPIKMARTILNLAKTKVWDVEKAGKKVIAGAEILHAARFNENTPLANFANGVDLTDDVINDLFTNGKISIGLTTRQQSVSKDQSGRVGYFAPFDYDTASLLNNIDYATSDLDKFLKEDAIFKYGFITSIAGTKFDANEYYLQADSAGLVTDACDILPPLYAVQFSGSSKTSDIFGSLNHKIETSNPKENTVTIERDSSGKILNYILEKYFTVSKDTLSKYVSGLPDRASFTIIKATPNSVTVRSIDGSLTTYNTINDPKALFDEMTVIDSNDNVISRNGEYSIVKNADGNYEINHNGITDPLDVVYVLDDEVGVIFNDELIVFPIKQNLVSVFKSKIPIQNGSIYLGTVKTGLGNQIYYSAGQTLSVREVGETLDSNSWITYQIITIDPDNNTVSLKKSNQISEIELPKEIFDKLRQANPTISIQKKPVQMSIKDFALKQFPKNIDYTGIEEDPDGWARSHASELNGIYKWNGKDAFKKDNSWESEMLMTFARWKYRNSDNYDSNREIEGIQDVIDSIENVVINSGRNTNSLFVTFTINKIDKQVKISRKSKGSKWTITELTTNNADSEYNKIVELLNRTELSEESKTNLLIMIRALKDDQSALEMTLTEDYNNWLIKVYEDPTSPEYMLLEAMVNAKQDEDNSEICKTRRR